MRSLIIAVALVLIGFGCAHAAVHQYRLDGSYADDYGGPNLVPASGTLGANDYTFGPNQGLSLTGALANTGVYTIEIQFKFNDVVGWQKIIDFKNLGPDTGFYSQNGTLSFYNFATGGSFPANIFQTVVITRDGGNQVKAYINGALAFQFNDSSSAGVFSTNSIHFFKDDAATGFGEAAAGTVNYIRTYDEALSAGQVAALQAPTAPVPEPATILIWGGLAACGLVPALRRKPVTNSKGQ
jgi:hypothetical protein